MVVNTIYNPIYLLYLRGLRNFTLERNIHRVVSMKHPELPNYKLNFSQIKLHQFKYNLENTFKDYKSKTINQTLDRNTYKNLKNKIEFDTPLGEFLFKLKEKGDKSYLKFLNNYGDKTYSHFGIVESDVDNKKGIYSYYLNDEIQYIGITKDNFKKRINSGYGKISPKNCYKDGQSTNCHLNWLISSSFKNIKFFVYIMDELEGIENLEKQLIEKYNPSWNTQLKIKT